LKGFKHQKFKKEDLERLYFEDKLSLSQIGKIFNCCSETISNHFKKHNIKTRSVSEALTGREIKWKDKISEGNKGKKLSESTKQKISKARIGTPSPLKGLSKAENPDIVKYGVKKEKHWNWKGGISNKNHSIRATSEYRVWRRSVYKRDKYTCQICSKTKCYLNAHHIKSLSDLIKENQPLFEVENGITLCKDCHKKVHKNEITLL
jgi:hypothetical protein